MNRVTIRHIKRQTYWQSLKQNDRQSEIWADSRHKDKDKETENQTYGKNDKPQVNQTGTNKDKKTNTWTDKQTNKQTDKQTDRQTNNKQTDKQSIK